MRKIQSKSLSLWHFGIYHGFGEATRSSGFWRQRRSLWNGRFPSSLRRVQKLKRHRKSLESYCIPWSQSEQSKCDSSCMVQYSTGIQVSWSKIILIWESERESCLFLSLGPKFFTASCHDVLGCVWITRKISTPGEASLLWGREPLLATFGRVSWLFLEWMEPSKFYGSFIFFYVFVPNFCVKCVKFSSHSSLLVRQGEYAGGSRLRLLRQDALTRRLGWRK